MGLRRDQRHPLVLSVRISGTDGDGKPFSQASCTLDVNKQGARLYGIRCLRGPGEIITIQYKKNRGRFRVVWVGEPRTPRDGQVGIRNLEPENDVWGLDLPSNQVDDYVRPVPKSGIELQAEAAKETTSAIEKLAGLLNADSTKAAAERKIATPVAEIHVPKRADPMPPEASKAKEPAKEARPSASVEAFEVTGSKLDRVTGHHVPATSGGLLLQQLSKWFQSNENLNREGWEAMLDEEIMPHLDLKEKALVEFFRDENQSIPAGVTQNRNASKDDRKKSKNVI